MTFPNILILTFLLALTSACPDEQYCLQCSPKKDTEARVCLECENSFWNTDKKACETSISKTVDHCKGYDKKSDQVTCNNCDAGYFIDGANNACVKCSVDNCALCNTKQVCFGCFNSMKLDVPTNTCLKDQKCEVLNCSICVSDSGKNSCAYCATGFALKGDTQSCVAAPANCYMVDSDGAKECNACNYGYYIAGDGTCKADGSSWWWLWLVLILLVLAVIGFFVYNHFQKNNNEQMEVYRGA